MAMTKGLTLFFCQSISRIRLEGDEGEGYIWSGRKEIDGCGCNIRNGEDFCEDGKKKN